MLSSSNFKALVFHSSGLQIYSLQQLLYIKKATLSSIAIISCLSWSRIFNFLLWISIFWCEYRFFGVNIDFLILWRDYQYLSGIDLLEYLLQKFLFNTWHGLETFHEIYTVFLIFIILPWIEFELITHVSIATRNTH